MSSKRIEWLNKACEGKNERDRRLLDIASKTFYRNIVTKENSKYEIFPWGDRRAITPSANIYDGIWNWDSAFHIVALSRWDTELAAEQCEIFFKFQLENGMYPDCISTSGLVVDSFGKPPVLPWSFTVLYKATKDKSFLEKAYASCVKNLDFWEKHRRVDDLNKILFKYDSVATDPKQRYTDIRFESGWDTSVRWDITAELYPIDLNCYMLTFYKSMEYMAEELGYDSSKYKNSYKNLADEINRIMWDENTGCYYDIGIISEKPTYVMSSASFMPLYAGIASKSQAEKMNSLALKEEKFYPYMPTVSYDNPSYEAENYWRGPSWLNASYFACERLKNYGFGNTASSITETLLNAAYDNLGAYEVKEHRSASYTYEK